MTRFRDPAHARIVPDLLAGRARVEIDQPATRKDGTPRKKQDRSKHRDLVIAIAHMLHAEGCHVRTVQSQARLLTNGTWLPGLNKGMLDIYAAVPPTGRMLALDAKIGSDRLRPEQAQEVRSIRAAGGVAGEARSLDDAKNLLAEARSGSHNASISNGNRLNSRVEAKQVQG